MKIRFFINTLGGGGAEKVLVDLLKCLTEQGIECTLLTITGGTNKKNLTDTVNYCQIVKTKNKFLNKFFSRIVYHLPKRWIEKMFFKGEYDIEIAYLEGFPTRVIATLNKKSRKFAFVHCDISVNNIISPYYKTTQACIDEYKKFDKICFVSQKALSGFEQMFGKFKNGCVVHNVLNVTEIIRKSKLPTIYSYSSVGCKLVTVGRLSVEKQYDRLFRIVKQLEAKYEFQLWVIGEGDLRGELEQYIADNQIKSIKMFGFQENPYNLVKQADLFICSSLFEGYSTAVSESILLGVPVLTTDCAGMDEILDNGKYGWIVENSEEALEKGLENLLKKQKEIFDKKKIIDKKIGDSSCNKGIKEYLELINGV